MLRYSLHPTCDAKMELADIHPNDLGALLSILDLSPVALQNVINYNF
jgi:hypothetical protein